jgi:hypothetical protein
MVKAMVDERVKRQTSPPTPLKDQQALVFNDLQAIMEQLPARTARLINVLPAKAPLKLLTTHFVLIIAS